MQSRKWTTDKYVTLFQYSQLSAYLFMKIAGNLGIMWNSSCEEVSLVTV